jgi:hypothetical protein
MSTSEKKRVCVNVSPRRNPEKKGGSVTWRYVFVFLIGSIYSSVAGEPVSNLFFFLRASTGVPLSPVEAVFWENYAPAVMYAIIAAIFILLAVFTNVSPDVFRYFFAVYAGVAMILSFYVLKFNVIAVFLFSLTYIVILIGLFWRIDAKIEQAVDGHHGINRSKSR